MRQAQALRDKEERLGCETLQAREESQAARGAPRNDGAAAFFDGDDQLLEEEDAGRREREQVRIERKRERERQMRLDNAKGDMKRSRLERARSRREREGRSWFIEGFRQIDGRSASSTSGCLISPRHGPGLRCRRRLQRLFQTAS